MNNSYPGMVLSLLMIVPFLAALVIYIAAVIVLSRRHKSWPLWRVVFWTCGIFCAVISLTGPLAQLAHIDFRGHMLGHLLLGMLAPLFIVLSAPITLILKTLDVRLARRFTRLLKSWPASILSHPIVTTLLNMGGLWILYRSELYAAMHHNPVLHVIIHFHVFAAGYLFTASMIYIDPAPHRKSFLYRSVVLTLALASHGILSKHIYSFPPPGVPSQQAEMGGMLMYYGGDAIDIVLIFILCLHWYRVSRPRALVEMGHNA